jgi:hypothetical protein
VIGVQGGLPELLDGAGFDIVEELLDAFDAEESVDAGVDEGALADDQEVLLGVGVRHSPTAASGLLGPVGMGVPEELPASDAALADLFHAGDSQERRGAVAIASECGGGVAPQLADVAAEVLVLAGHVLLASIHR